MTTGCLVVKRRADEVPSPRRIEVTCDGTNVTLKRRGTETIRLQPGTHDITARAGRVASPTISVLIPAGESIEAEIRVKFAKVPGKPNLSNWIDLSVIIVGPSGAEAVSEDPLAGSTQPGKRMSRRASLLFWSEVCAMFAGAAVVAVGLYRGDSEVSLLAGLPALALLGDIAFLHPRRRRRLRV
jgi:hypothetical protein